MSTINPDEQHRLNALADDIEALIKAQQLSGLRSYTTVVDLRVLAAGD